MFRGDELPSGLFLPLDIVRGWAVWSFCGHLAPWGEVLIICWGWRRRKMSSPGLCDISLLVACTQWLFWKDCPTDYGDSLYMQNTSVPGIYILTRAALTHDLCRNVKVQLLCFELGQILRYTFHFRAPCKIIPRLDLLQNQPPLCVFSFPVLLPSLPTTHLWEHFLNQSLAHKSLVPSRGPVISPRFAYHSCSVNICCLNEWIHEWMNKLGKPQTGGIWTGYYTNYRLSTFSLCLCETD